MAAEKTTEPDEVLTDEELQAAAAPEPDSANNNEAHKRTVVVAEDESVNRMDLVAMLEDNGYEVVGEQILRLLPLPIGIRGLARNSGRIPHDCDLRQISALSSFGDIA